jgi:hypothetical protein
MNEKNFEFLSKDGHVLTIEEAVAYALKDN